MHDTLVVVVVMLISFWLNFNLYHAYIDKIYFTIADDYITCNHCLATLLKYN